MNNKRPLLGPGTREAAVELAEAAQPPRLFLEAASSTGAAGRVIPAASSEGTRNGAPRSAGGRGARNLQGVEVFQNLTGTSKTCVKPGGVLAAIFAGGFSGFSRRGRWYFRTVATERGGRRERTAATRSDDRSFRVCVRVRSRRPTSGRCPVVPGGTCRRAQPSEEVDANGPPQREATIGAFAFACAFVRVGRRAVGASGAAGAAAVGENVRSA